MYLGGGCEVDPSLGCAVEQYARYFDGGGGPEPSGLGSVRMVLWLVFVFIIDRRQVNTQ